MSADTNALARRLLATVCGRDISTISEDDRLADLGLDSLDLLLLAVLIEETSNQAIPDDVLTAVRTVTDIERHLRTHGVPL
jgi:acyl carrier protein